MLVIKIGGGKNINATAIAKNAAEIIKTTGEKIVIINGGNARLNQKMREAGYAPKMITSERGEKSRLTDKKTIEFLKKVYIYEIANSLVNILQKCGVDAINLSKTKTDNPIIAKQHGRMRIVENGKVKVINADLTGKIIKVEIEKIQTALDQNKIPIICPPAKTEDGKELNVDGDKIASKIAIALQADKLLFFSGTNGLLKNVHDNNSTIPEISIQEADNFAIGRMKKKVLSAKRAIEAGVGEVIFGDGRSEVDNPIDLALSRESGTRVVRECFRNF
jgi:[amino group carrier protein]-L-2-aminoadipate 6-kinase